MVISRRFLKAHDWWDSKLPLLLAIGYYQFTRAPQPSALTCLRAALLFLVSCVGLAGFGYLLNDWTDLAQDRAVGQPNLMAARREPERLAALGLSLVVAAVPWPFLPHQLPVVPLLLGEVALLTAYSVPPLRLKGRGSWGVLADALYGYTLLLVVSLEVFGRVVHVDAPAAFWLPLVAWSLTLGARHVITHQLGRVRRDESFDVRTLAVRMGWDTTFRVLYRVVLPMEAALFVVLLVLFGQQTLLVPAGFVVHAGWRVLRTRHSTLWTLRSPMHLEAVDRVFAANILVMSRFQTGLLPILLLASVCAPHPAFLLLLAVHLLLFWPALR